MLILSWNVAGLSTTLQRIFTDYNNINTPNETNEHDDNDARNCIRIKVMESNENKEKSISTTKHPLESERTQKSKTFHDTNIHGTINAKKTTLRPKAQVKAKAQFLSDYLSLHNADIICFQEHKISQSTISNRTEAFSCCSQTTGYESFWSCCIDPKKRGFNGVCTFARVGTTINADRSILGDAELDDQGRCIMTDHGAFVLFNVYVPALGGQTLTYKMKFLNALRKAMNQKRNEEKRHVILVGDLNIAHTKHDVYWNSRMVDVNKVLKEADKNATSNIPKWKTDVQKHWDKILTVLKSRKVVPIKTKNIHVPGSQFEKYRVSVKLPNNNNNANSDQEIFLGKAEENPEYALQSYDFDEASFITYFDEDTKVEQKIQIEPNIVSVKTLTELMSKIGKIWWDEPTQRLIADTSADINRFSPGRDWLTKVIEEDGMIDAMKYFYPHAKGRFTCWNQQTNSRYHNVGARIDYTLVDKTLLPYIARGKVPSLRYGTEHKSTPSTSSPKLIPHETRELHEKFSLTEEAALLAATANGRFQGASFLGGGISNVSQIVLNTQFGPPHTGIIYTPPMYSDHVGVSLLLLLEKHDCSGNDETQDYAKNMNKCKHSGTGTGTEKIAMDNFFSKSLVLDENDKKTKKTQPFKNQQSIFHFLTRESIPDGSSTNAVAQLSTHSLKQKHPMAQIAAPVKKQKKTKHTIDNFFSKSVK